MNNQEWNYPPTKPKKFGKYEVLFDDNSTDTEKWNGLCWAYNSDRIVAWKTIIKNK